MNDNSLMTNSLVLYLLGLLGFLINRRSFINLLLSIELMLLATTLVFLESSYFFDDLIGLPFGLFIIAIAAAESAIGLGVLVAYYRLRGSITLEQF
uniref:NADH-ubiquinone oxidoreductase chain 4L n=2 Tax=Gigaspora TaxID=4873 RepID=H9EBD4_9GLOM|nr:NADH dehydrogenase subunit 4L [Gigaspora rosea]AFD04117.1 NADH dehydrogenase subunit 4L [Gigaspora rosea]